MPTIFQWIAANWQFICKFFTAIYLVVRLGRFFTTMVLKVSSVVERFELAESTLTTVATNHLPHIQAAVEDTNRIMSSVDETLKKILAHETGDYE
jgi:hypothetical protein